MRRFILALFLIVALTGCTSITRLTDCRGVKVEDGLTPVEVVDIYNSNWLFLSWLPIASGDPDCPDEVTAVPFRNTVTLENQIKMLEREVNRCGAKKAINVMSTTTDESAVFFLLMREKYHTTAVLVK